MVYLATMSDTLDEWTNHFDYRIIIAFIVGMIMGMILLCLIYALLVLLSLRDKKFRTKVNPESLKESEALEMIARAQASFKDKSLRGDMTKSQYFRRLTSELVYGIASSFYPDSKYPLLEITVDEAIDLIGYVQTELNIIFDKKLIKLLKRLKISDVVSMSLSTKNVVDSKAFKMTKSVSNVASKIKKAVDYINPVNWFRRLVVDNVIKIVVNKLYLVTLGIVGEQAYKIYSKSALKVETEIDSGVNELVDSIEDDIKEITTSTEKEENVRFMSKAYSLNDSKFEYQSQFDLNYKFMGRIVEEQDEKEEKEQ